MANDLTPSTWAVSVLRRLNIQPTAGAVQALVGWARAEGGHWNNNARYNPLNTTQPEPGAGNTGTQGNIKVYKSWDQGIDATVQTLRSGRYGGIIAGLKSGDPRAVASAIDQSPWGTHGALIHNAISSAPAAVPHVPSSNPTGGTTRAPAATTTTTATPGVDNSGVRRSLIFDYLHSGGVKSAGATQTLASGWVNAQDVPGTTTTTTSAAPARPGGSSPLGPTSSPTANDFRSRADAINAKHLPYQWGGGHGGKVDPTKATPLDCSGAVSAVLGINPRVASQFETFGKPGDGGNRGVTIYAKSTHVLMKIDGHFFGTSSTNPGGGAGWIPQAAISPEYLKGFTVRHV
jgi:hypothetical protein